VKAAIVPNPRPRVRCQLFQYFDGLGGEAFR
jgi:hypothetical protein